MTDHLNKFSAFVKSRILCWTDCQFPSFKKTQDEFREHPTTPKPAKDRIPKKLSYYYTALVDVILWKKLEL